MKINFKKISAIASSVLLAGMTMGVAAAANYPAPFVDGSSSDVAIVYGASSLDSVAASNIQDDLASSFTGGASAISGGESFELTDGSDVFNFADNLGSVYDDLSEDEMDFLADGDYDDGDIDEGYSQTINLHANGVLTLLENDYDDTGNEPTIGIEYEKSEEILNYVLEFDSTISMEDMEDTDLPMLGAEYYVLDVDNGTTDSITLLDTAEKTTVKIDESVTVNGKTVTLDYVDSDSAKLIVGTELTDDLELNEEYELEDDSYIVVTDISYQDYLGGVQGVEFSLGSGKIFIEHDKEIEVNDERVDNLYGEIDASTDDLTSITITWKADDDLYLTEDNSLTMPSPFNVIGLEFESMNFPSDPEAISLVSGNALTLDMENFDIELLTSETADAIYMGEDGHLLVTKAETLSSNYTGEGYDNITTLTGGLHLYEDDRFIVTYLDTDLSEVEQAYYEVETIDYAADDDIELELTDLISDNDMDSDDWGEEIDGDGADIPGLSVDININITAMNDTCVYLNFTSDDTFYFNKVVSDKGLLFSLPEKDRNDAVDISTETINFTEQDEDGDVGEGTTVEIDISNSSENDKVYADTDDADVTIEEKLSDDKYIGYVESVLATKLITDESGDEYDFDLEYYGEEVTATINVVAEGEVSTTTGLGSVVVMDTEVNSVKDKNLIVVGGSCINSVAAALVGAHCGAAFTTATGVGAGEYLIKSYTSPHNSDKIALLVAGYEKEDTTAAAEYLMANTIDTSSVDMTGTTVTASS